MHFLAFFSKTTRRICVNFFSVKEKRLVRYHLHWKAMHLAFKLTELKLKFLKSELKEKKRKIKHRRKFHFISHDWLFSSLKFAFRKLLYIFLVELHFGWPADIIVLHVVSETSASYLGPKPNSSWETQEVTLMKLLLGFH